MPINSINTAEDFNALIQQAPLVVVTSYRGKWCPFCRTYLREFDEARKSFPAGTLLVGISVDTVDECEKLKHKLGLGYELVSDETLIMRELLNVNTGKGHGKEAYLQPSVFIFKDGEQVFEWIQEPTLMNLGGAISRIPVSKVTETLTNIC
jgi:peroxiredoxin